jgi:putative FmdB family regulatory protein
MPIYDFRCNKCKHQEEVLIRNEAKPFCPKCNEEMDKLYIGRAQNHKPDIY